MNKYDVMNLSNTSDGEEGFYYDPLSLPLDSFRVNRNPVRKELRAIDKPRFDLLMFRAYGSVSFDDILLMLNNVGYLNDIDKTIGLAEFNIYLKNLMINNIISKYDFEEGEGQILNDSVDINNGFITDSVTNWTDYNVVIAFEYAMDEDGLGVTDENGNAILTRLE